MSQLYKEILVGFQLLSATICFQEEPCQHNKEAEFQQPWIGHSKESQDGPFHRSLPEPVKQQ